MRVVFVGGVSRTMSELKSPITYPSDCVNSTIFSGFLSILATVYCLAESRQKKQNPTRSVGLVLKNLFF